MIHNVTTKINIQKILANLFSIMMHKYKILLKREGSNFCKILKYSHMAYF